MLNSHMHSKYYYNVVVFLFIYEKQKCVMVFKCVLQVNPFIFPPSCLISRQHHFIYSNLDRFEATALLNSIFLLFPFLFQNDSFISSAYVVKAAVFPWARSCEKADSCFFPLKFG